MNEQELAAWGVPGVVHSVQDPTNPATPTDYRALADAYIQNTQNQNEQQYNPGGAPTTGFWEGQGSDVPQAGHPAGYTERPDVLTQFGNAVQGAQDYMTEPYQPKPQTEIAQALGNNVEQRYAGTPRYQQIMDYWGITAPRANALGSASGIPTSVREGNVW